MSGPIATIFFSFNEASLHAREVAKEGQDVKVVRLGDHWSVQYDTKDLSTPNSKTIPLNLKTPINSKKSLAIKPLKVSETTPPKIGPRAHSISHVSEFSEEELKIINDSFDFYWGLLANKSSIESKDPIFLKCFRARSRL